MHWITAHPIPSIACVVMIVLILLIVYTSARSAAIADDQIERMTSPRFTFADSDIQDTLDELLQKHPEIVSLKAEKGEMYYIRVTNSTIKPGREHIGYGPVVIMAVPEDGE